MLRRSLLGVSLLLLATVTAFRVVPQEGSVQKTGIYRILVTNDDGIEAPGLKALVAELAKVGEVEVSAPDVNYSGASHSTSIMRKPLEVIEHQIPGAKRAVGVSATPGDSAAFGILELGRAKPFDVVVSGINAGANIGLVSHYSGTIGAAMEAARNGRLAVAVSADGDYAVAARFTARFVSKLLDEKVKPGIVYSINVPAMAADAKPRVVCARMGEGNFLISGFQKKSEEGGKAIWAPVAGKPAPAEDGTDTKAFLEGAITVTPLRFDWSDEDAVAELNHWELVAD
jgi:5'-nucleotidase